MENNMFTEIQFMVFNRIALAHTLIDSEYRYELKNIGYGIYGKTPKSLYDTKPRTKSVKSNFKKRGTENV